MGQPRKDSRDKRVNYDNTRVSKFEKDTRKVRGSKSRGRTARPKDNRQQDTKYVDGTNDVSWYANNPELLRAAASLPFSVVNGQLIDTVPSQNKRSIPNTMTLHWNPTIGSFESDAINQAANSMYSFIVHANSRNYKYNAMDLMLLIQAGASFFSMLALGIRTYGVMRLYDQRNKFMPDDWIAMSGFDPADLKKNMSQMWFDLNQLVSMSQQIWIPNTMPAITRWFWLNSNIYMDANSAKAQYYMFVPETYLLYDETSDPQGGCLKYVKWMAATSPTNTGTVRKTWAEYMFVMNTMLQRLIQSEDRGIIFGDVLKAYGAEKIYSVSPISVDYTVVPVYNPEVLTQIENTIVWPNVPSGRGPWVTETPGTFAQGGIFQDQVNLRLYSKIYFETEANITSDDSYFCQNCALPHNPILNFHQQALPTPEQIMVATRLMATGMKSGVSETLGDSSSTKGVWFSPAVCGTEFISRIFISYFALTSDKVTMQLMEQKFSRFYGAVTNAIQDSGSYYAFDWAPIWYYLQKVSKFSAYELSNMKTTPTILRTTDPYAIYCEYDNWTSVALTTLEKMHTAAIYSEFGVPIIM